MSKTDKLTEKQHRLPYFGVPRLLPYVRKYRGKIVAMVFFGMNTFTGRECGTGFEEPDLFKPSSLNTDQWAKVVKTAGMKGLIFACKHYDGFCLWPTEQTDYSVKSSEWLGGQGDVVKSVADSCRKYGLKFGIYLPLWDKHEPSYGQGKAYDTFFLNQLRELLTDYGDVFCVWLDGTCDRGKNDPEQSYDLEAYYALIRELQPNAVIADIGPDVRWCGNYMGVCRESEWSVVPAYYNIIRRAEMNYTGRVDYALPDLGERKRIKSCSEFVWYPCAVNVSLRGGRFYKKEEDYAIKPLNKVMKLYEASAGANASLILGLSPQPDGTLDDILAAISVALANTQAAMAVRFTVVRSIISFNLLSGCFADTASVAVFARIGKTAFPKNLSTAKGRRRSAAGAPRPGRTARTPRVRPAGPR